MEEAKAYARALVAEAVPLLEPLLTTVSIGVVVVDVRVPDQPVVYANPAVEAISGYPAAEMIGHNCRMLQSEDTDPAARAEMRAAIAEGRTTAVTVLNRRRDGTPFYNEIRLAPIPSQDGGLPYYLGLLTDVSERVRAEQRLASARALHSSVFNVVAEGILVLRSDGSVVDANPAALGTLGLSRKQIDGPRWWEQLEVEYESGDPFLVATSPGRRAITRTSAFHSAMMRFRRGDGARRRLSVSYEPLARDGGPERVLISFRDVTEHQQTLEDLQQFESLVSLSSDFVAIAGLDQEVFYVNPAGLALVGLDSLEQARAKRAWDFLTEEGVRSWLETEQASVLATGRWEGEGTLRHFGTGEPIPVRISSYLLRRPDSGEPWGLATVQRDITEEKAATARLEASRRRYEAQFRSLPLPAFVWQRRADDFQLVDWNEAAEHVGEGGMEALRGAWAGELYDDAPEVLLGFERCWSTRAPVTHELPYRRRTTGAETHLIFTWAYVPPDLVLVHTLDIGERVAFEAQLRTMAERDDLTGLHNRRYFERRLTEALGHDHAAVVIVDVDHFKFVNDSLGHGPGDDLLRDVASTMQTHMREQDVIARFGGDEFAVLLTGPEADRAPEVAGHLLAAIRTLTGVSVTASAGAAIFDPETSAGASDAIVAADIALYRAKQLGRDRVEVYAGQAGESLTWLEQIRAAIAADRLLLYRQRVIRLSGHDTGQSSYELLVRMAGPGGEIIPPDSFLPTAEQFGLIRDVDRWVVERGIPLARDMSISINLSARSLGDSGLTGTIAALIERHGVPAGNITFEFTETAAVSSVEDARAFTRALREIGCHAALDDFGTGFGTFVLLKHLPVDALKIDREFVRDLSSSADDQRIVRSIVRIASEAGMSIVAEGVEDAGALALLREYGVGWAQGFHIHRPEPVPAPPG
ncbi:MAG TPA: EAL domain-containing protein [Solirubrobacteraceae bacterium]|nr:EAL domain-containing protein [Solirubrobacteraceae bacterium]